MPGLEDRLKHGLRRLGEPVAPTDVFERVEAKRSRRRVVRRMESGFLAVVVLAAAAGGIYGLVRAFHPGTPVPNPLGSTPVNGRIAYVVGIDTAEIWTADPDGTGAATLLDGREPAWSPDGTRIAFRRGIPQQSGEKTHILVANADGTDAHTIFTLPVEPGTAGPPTWSPDGNRLAFANIDGIYVVGADGANPHRIAMYEGTHACYDLSPSWSPNGTTIAFAVRCDGGEEGIWAVDADGSNRRRLLAPSASIEALSYPAFSPDGRRIAFTGAPPPYNGNGSIYVMNADGSGVTEIVDGAWWSSPVSWSPDGAELAYVQADGGIAVMNPDGTAIRRLGVDGISPSWQQQPVGSTVQSPSPQANSCGASEVRGDFDGDGLTDIATTSYPAPAGGCDQVVEHPEYSLAVDYGDGASFEQGPPAVCEDLRGACRAFAAPDLNDDGTDELVLQVGQGASTAIVRFYSLDHETVRAFVLDDPAALTDGEPLQLAWGGSVTHQDRFECRHAQGTGPIFVVITSGLNAESGHQTFSVVETHFEVVGMSFHDVGESRYQIPADSPDLQKIQAGNDICGAPVGGGEPSS